MKSLSIALLFTLSIAFALASPAPDAAAAAVPEKEQKATTECNATNPVQQNPREKIAVVVATGQKAQFSHEEKCFLNCFLQKVGFFDENSNIKNGSGLIKYTVKQAPELAKYSDVLIAQIFQISRSTKHFEDKCQKAFVVYHQFAQGVFTLAVAEGLQSLTGIKEKIINAVENGQNVDQDIQKQVQQYLTFFDALVTAFAQESQKASQ
ncbi:uncharacterized protein LOC135838592 [Planococcus citri]|uniref:uncharacterized protein LOC135838592 n=1 Tax=Planococcus citri TaxID=170843 RepID=UPI0031F7A974